MHVQLPKYVGIKVREVTMQDDSTGQWPAPVPIMGAITDIGFEEVQQVEKTVRRLRRGNPVRKIARDVMNRRPVDSAQPLIASLVGTTRPASERQIAAWALGWTPLDASDRQAAMSILRDVLEGEQPGDPLRFLRIGTRSLMISAVCTFVIVTVKYGWNRYDAADLFFQMLFMMIMATLVTMTPISLYIDRTRANRVRAAAAASLGRLQCLDSVGALTAALYDRSPVVRRAAVPALSSVLPLLTPEHYGQLSVQAIPNLCRALGHSDIMLVLHVLSALEIVGDGRTVRPVQQLITTGRNDQVRNLAAQILPVLQERQHMESASKMLLRASDATSSAGATLLRPSSMMPPPTLTVRSEISSPFDMSTDETEPEVLRINNTGSP